MKVILYMATTANGYIAKENDDTSWISKEEWNSYSKAVRDAGNMVIGHRTYEILTTQPEFAELQDVRIVVLAHSDVHLLSEKHLLAHSPAEALELLQGSSEVVVAGGSMVNAAFLSQGLVDELYLDIEPLLLGTGIPLLERVGSETALELIATNMLSPNEVQLHYRVKR
jgi:dihydrofolate reductase